nr:DnaA/Hda family protein [Pelistega indica]
MKEFWQQCIEYLSDGLAPEQIKQWILPLKPIGFNDDETEFHISAPSILKQSWATEYYAPKIQQLIKNRFNHDVIVKVLIKKPTSTPVTTSVEPISSSSAEQEAAELPELMTAPTSSVTTVDAHEPIAEPEIISGIEVSIENEDDTVVVTPPSISKQETKPLSTGRLQVNTPNLEVVVKESYKFTNLNPYLTFENLVVGKSNEMAHASAENVVRHVGQKGYNPLFIYGSSGLGKTHLMHAIGNELFNKYGYERMRYIHAETYYTDFVKRMRNGELVDYRMQDMQEYEQLDLLLIDDIQFFTKKGSTQKEFFYLFDAMINKNKQVVISSDTYPRELEEMDSRLITRFNSGLVIAIEPPELEMRVAILLKKADTHYSHLTLTD